MHEETAFFNYTFGAVWCIFLTWYWDIEPNGFTGLPLAAVMFSVLAANKAIDLMKVGE